MCGWEGTHPDLSPKTRVRLNHWVPFQMLPQYIFSDIFEAVWDLLVCFSRLFLHV